MTEPKDLRTTGSREENLDPEDWRQLRKLGHQMLDDMLDYLETVAERPVWQAPPAEVRQRLNEPLPVSPTPLEDVYGQFKRDVLPYPMGNIHPRFWAWVMGGGTPVGVLAEMLAATMNPNMGGGQHSAQLVETQVIAWMREIFGFPEGSSGLLVSGGSMANLVALAVARHAGAGVDVRKLGHSADAKLSVYASTAVHSSVQKAVELMGMGADSLRLVPVSANGSIEVSALRRMLHADRAEGRRPVCVIGNAGSVNTGAMDDLEAIADLCRNEQVWFHVDGAFGAWAVIDPQSRHLVQGMERADSVAFDLHKWMYMPFEIGCVLVRNGSAHKDTFTVMPAYLQRATRGIAGGEDWFSEYGVQLSRGFRALKAWMSLKTYGLDKYRRMIRQNIEQARYLGQLVEQAPSLELVAPVALNIVAFRYLVPGADAARLDALNQEILLQLQERGIAAPSLTQVNGKTVLRVANVNHRTRRADMDILVSAVQSLGMELAAQMR